jgi:hypothetical protein
MGDTSESTLVGIKGYEEFDLKDPNFIRFIKRRMKDKDMTQAEAIEDFENEMKKFKKKKDKKNKVPGGKNGGQVVKMKDGGGFPDLTGDGKVTRADVLKGRGVFKKGGAVNKKKIIRAAKRGFGAAKRGY